MKYSLSLVLLSIIFLSLLFVVVILLGKDENGRIGGGIIDGKPSATAFSSWQARKQNIIIPENNKNSSILFMAASYSFSQYMELWKTLENLRDICNAGWNVTIHLQVANGLQSNKTLLGQLSQSLQCIRNQQYMSLVITEYDPAIGFGLNSRHRAIATKYLQEYDYFIYAEEDMHLTYTNWLAYLQGMEDIKRIYPMHWQEYTIGFLRYEEDLRRLTRVTWEYAPEQVHLVSLAAGNENDHNAFGLVTVNLNQAINIFSREQLQSMEIKCAYLSKPGNTPFYQELRRAMNLEWKHISVGVSEWSSSFQHVLQCGIKRVLPIRLFHSLLIHHGTNIAQQRRNKKHLLTMQSWDKLLTSLQTSSQETNKSFLFPSIESFYREVIVKQYNLDRLDYAKLQKRKIKYVSWLKDNTNQ